MCRRNTRQKIAHRIASHRIASHDMHDAQQRRSLKGVRCRVCFELGMHTSDECPKRHTVGTPVPLQRKSADAAPQRRSADGVFPRKSADGISPRESADAVPAPAPLHDDPCPPDACAHAAIAPSMKPFCAALPSDCLTNDELVSFIRSHPAVPELLHCAACDLLPIDAMYCQSCAALTCAQCLGPSDMDWMCPQCRACAIDNFVVVTPLRVLIQLWFVGCARRVDPYSVDTDDDADGHVECHTDGHRKRKHAHAIAGAGAGAGAGHASAIPPATSWQQPATQTPTQTQTPTPTPTPTPMTTAKPTRGPRKRRRGQGAR